MKALATFIMRGRSQAILLTAAFAVLSLMLPPFSYISGGIIALVTLRKGAGEGALVSLVAGAIMAALSMATMGHIVLAAAYLIVVWMPIWVLAQVLRKTVSMPLTLTVAGAMGVLGVLAIYAVLDDPVAWWRAILEQFFSQALSQAQLPDGMMGTADALDAMSTMMTGLMASAFIVSLIFSLVLGRWWQATLYNPGGFKQEFLSLRLDKTSAVIAVVVMIAAFVADGFGNIATDLAAVILTIASIPGLALMHDWVANGGGNTIFLVVLYVLLLFAMPQMTAALALSAIIDSWIDLRRHFKKST
ncbi:MAG: hypothetical protein OEX19_01160 [Gammaproteobacteria bacterium]|nr:hypothetical protein [Gammaproteobacteria bacterium]